MIGREGKRNHEGSDEVQLSPTLNIVTCTFTLIFLHTDKGMSFTGSQHIGTLRIKVTLSTT